MPGVQISFRRFLIKNWEFIVKERNLLFYSKYEVCPESIRPTFISPRHSVQATSAGHERQQ